MKISAHGFTLIELLIVVAVIGVLSAIAIPSFSSFNTNQRLSQAAKQVKNDLRSAQNRAVNGVKDSAGNKVWGLSFDGSNSYTIFTCSSLDLSAVPCCIGETSYETKSLASGFVISNGLFVFDQVSGDICDVLGALVSGSSSVSVNLSGSSRTVTVSAGGKIEEN